MKKMILSFILFIAYFGTKAQYSDYCLEVQRIVMQNNMMLNNYTEQMIKMIGKQEKHATAFSMFVPDQQKDIFSAYIIIPPYFKPGYKIPICNKSSSHELFKENIPGKYSEME